MSRAQRQQQRQQQQRRRWYRGEQDDDVYHIGIRRRRWSRRRLYDCLRAYGSSRVQLLRRRLLGYRNGGGKKGKTLKDAAPVYTALMLWGGRRLPRGGVGIVTRACVRACVSDLSLVGVIDLEGTKHHV